MSAECAPGTVARATVRGLTDVRVMWDGIDWVGAKVGNRYEHGADDVTDVRPLVVLDLDPEMYDAGLIRNLVADLRNDWPSVADQIAAQAKPPKPAEPTGLGAVVEDSSGRKWIRVSNTPGTFPWLREGYGVEGWTLIDAVRVLSEGVTA